MSHLLGYPGHERLLPDIVRAENASLFDSAGRRYVDPLTTESGDIEAFLRAFEETLAD